MEEFADSTPFTWQELLRVIPSKPHLEQVRWACGSGLISKNRVTKQTAIITLYKNTDIEYVWKLFPEIRDVLSAIYVSEEDPEISKCLNNILVRFAIHSLVKAHGIKIKLTAAK